VAPRPSEIVAEVLRRMLTPGALGDVLHVGPPFGRRAALAAADALAGGDAGAAGGAGADAQRDSDHAAARGEAQALLRSGAYDAAEEAVIARVRRLAAVDVDTLGPRLDPQVVRLAALLHDVLVAFHPDLPGVFGGERPRRLLEATAKAIGEVPPPATLREALLRDAWIAPLLSFELVRTAVRFWVGSREFVGRAPPARLLAWPEVRRVHRDDRRAAILSLPDLFAAARGDARGTQDARAALAEPFSRAMGCLLAASPLTDLALAGRTTPVFAVTPAIEGLIASAAGARVARRAIASGGRGAREAVRLASATVAERLELAHG
jgi:hypothetical protein